MIDLPLPTLLVHAPAADVREVTLSPVVIVAT
jgi:hypothetical protein